MSQTGLAIAGAVLGYYAYLRLVPQPVPNTNSAAKSTSLPAVHDRRWMPLRFLNAAHVHPNNWSRVKDPSAPVKYVRDAWTRNDRISHDPDILYVNPARRGLQRIITGGPQPRRNPAASRGARPTVNDGR